MFLRWLGCAAMAFLCLCARRTHCVQTRAAADAAAFAPAAGIGVAPTSASVAGVAGRAAAGAPDCPVAARSAGAPAPAFAGAAGVRAPAANRADPVAAGICGRGQGSRYWGLPRENWAASPEDERPSLVFP